MYNDVLLTYAINIVQGSAFINILKRLTYANI